MAPHYVGLAEENETKCQRPIYVSSLEPYSLLTSSEQAKGTEDFAKNFL